MKIVGVAACTSGIAHTYIAREKIIQAATKLGHEVHIETQGTIGTENALTPKEIEEADFVILAVDIKIGGKERFKGKKVFEVPTNVVIKSPIKLIELLVEKVKNERG
ncbi:fructose PTS transporter subunit IIB [Lactobacillus sp. ESL0791]|uniref:PTS fructose transporter subunit IIB n=1 Tax=Lactobacillus sp. ESL0791 TaxID=2983234 RepID=UPI0023F8253E|nr:fructose PTS transporter subunit IIB [Lactobacillus sp. ESL0791]MDF7638337.1 fructose PTS transporter subunit IIB [Lactobacillus sp. ESL0791]